MRGKIIYYGGNMERINSKGKDISDKGQDNVRDGKSKVQSFIYASDVLFIDNSVNRKSL